MKTNQKKDKFIDKIRGKKRLEKPVKRQITSANIEEHREKTLESGRKFKYPLHTPLHKILINAAIIFVIGAVGFVTFGWWRLYIAQDTSDFFYTAVRIVPVPVAEVDGELVHYGDYMRRLRASIYYLENQDSRDLTTEDGQRELEFTRRHNMDEAQKAAYAYKLAKEKRIEISEAEVDANIQATLDGTNGSSISAKAFESSLRRYFGWSMDDYRNIVRDRLMLRKVSFAVDVAARTKIDNIKQRLNVGEDFAALAGEFSEDVATKQDGGNVGSLSINNVDPDGLIAVAQTLTIGRVSDVIEGIDAFYIIKLNEKTDTAIKYSIIKISLSEFEKRFEQIRADGKIVEFITINRD
jgi:hypothetical protein